MSQPVTNNPQLPKGYKNTELGVIPEDWEVYNLDDLVKFTNGIAHENEIDESGQFVVVNSKFVSTEGLVRKHCKSLLNPAKKGDILMVMSDVPNGKAIAKCFMVDADQTYTVNQRICILTSLKVDYQLLFYKINRNPYYLKFDDGVKQTNLRRSEVLACPIPLPPTLAEQTAIATALSHADALINSLEKLIAKKKAIKQGAMQQLITPKEGWVVKKLGEVCEIFKGKGISKRLVIENGKNDCILYGELFTTYKDVINHVLSKTNATESVLSKKGDILFPGSTTTTGIDLAKASVIMKSNVLLGGDIVVLRQANYPYNPIFLTYFLNKIKKYEIAQTTKGITIHHLYGKDLAGIYAEFPSVDEQNKIATILSDMDAEISALESKVEKYRKVKLGMMQELLTGKTRLV